MAAYPNRCQHLKINGTQCGSPALRRHRFCFFHKRFHDERIRLSANRKRRPPATFILPVLEDANSIQVTLQQVVRMLLAQQIDHKTASLLLYALQTASLNLRRTRLEPLQHEVVLDPRSVVTTPLGADAWEDQDFEDECEDEEQDATEDETDRVIAALDEAKKKRASEVKWKRWAERQYGVFSWTEDHSKPAPDLPPDLKQKPSTEMDPQEIRAEISDMVRKELLPALPDILAKHAERKKAESENGEPENGDT